MVVVRDRGGQQRGCKKEQRSRGQRKKKAQVADRATTDSNRWCYSIHQMSASLRDLITLLRCRRPAGGPNDGAVARDGVIVSEMSAAGGRCDFIFCFRRRLRAESGASPRAECRHGVQGPTTNRTGRRSLAVEPQLRPCMRVRHTDDAGFRLFLLYKCILLPRRGSIGELRAFKWLEGEIQTINKQKEKDCRRGSLSDMKCAFH